MKRRPATVPSHRHTTPTSTRSGWAARRRSSAVQSYRATASQKRLGDGVHLGVAAEVGDQKAEFITPEAGVEILARTLLARTLRMLPRDEIVAPHLFAQQLSHPLDNLIAHGVAERVVVPLEAADIDQADRAPGAALLQRDERFELLDEPLEVHQLGLRVTLRILR